MGSKRILSSVMFFLLAVLVPLTVFGQGKYIRITANGVNVRVGPNTSSPIVAKARQGDVFELYGKEGRWYRIRMFSLSGRYVHRSFAEATPYIVSTPKRVSLRRDMFRALVRAEERAEAKADRRFPLEDRDGRPITVNVKKNIDYIWLLNDRYKLEVMHRFSVQPPVHRVIISEGIKKNW